MANEWETLYDKMVVQRHAAETVVKGMVVPDAHQKQQSIGIVLRVGEGRPLPDGSMAPLKVTPGMEVKFNSFSGVPLDDDDPDVIILREDEILAYRRN